MLGLHCCAGFALVAARGIYSLVVVHRLLIPGPLLSQSVGSRASVVAAHELSSYGSQSLEHRLNGYGAWAKVLPTTWDRPGLGIKLMSLVLTCGVLTTEPSGKSLKFTFC